MKDSVKKEEVKMNNETLGALEESINDWKKRAKGEDLGDKECPLCILGRKASGDIYMKCDDCIIKKHVGRTSCHATPYWDWIDSMKQFNTVKQLLCADQEVKFLESFLPKEKESNMKFVIKDNTDKKDVEVELFLRTEPNGSISVCGINSDDVQKILVSFKNGKMYKHCSANMKGIITLSFSDRIMEQETMW